MFQRLCQSVHETLIVGKCPWCGQNIVHGRDLLETLTDCTITNMEERVADPKEAMLSVRAALKSPYASIRKLAANYLGQMGPDAKEALPELYLLLQDSDQMVRDAAAQAIKNIEK